MKVGDYVRIDGYISKIEHIKTSSSEKTYAQWKQPNGMLASANIIIIDEFSTNIIDLIEVGDYVNGNRVDFTNSNNKLSYEDKCIGFYDGDGDITLFEKEIKSIVTKEQFESMEYKL